MYIPEKEYKNILRSVPIACVDLLIIHNNKCLLLKRENEPAKGQFWFPGGRIHKMETIEAAAIRKAKEETNLDCYFVKIISVEETIFEKNEFMETVIHTINICCHLVSENVEPIQFDRYHSEYRWVNKLNNSYHKAINHPLILMGFDVDESLIKNSHK